jgi:hypothetical protein
MHCIHPKLLPRFAPEASSDAAANTNLQPVLPADLDKASVNPLKIKPAGKTRQSLLPACSCLSNGTSYM